MSRSYKHSPVLVQQYEHRLPLKRAAAKVIRRVPLEEDIGNGRAYCRHFPQWGLREFSWYQKTGLTSRLYRKAGKGSEQAFVPVTTF